MDSALTKLLESNRLSKREEDYYVGWAHVDTGGRIYGGEILSQAVSAVQSTVDAGYSLHMSHANYLRMGDVNAPIHYQVERLRDGRSIVSRSVVARQHDEVIFHASMSFHCQRDGVAHQVDMPQAPGPEGLTSDAVLFQPFLGGKPYASPIEYFQADPVDFQNPQPGPPFSLTWFRAAGELPQDQRVHLQLLAYASDNPILVTALRPHGLMPFSPGLQTATLNHTLWIHDEIPMDDWLLFEAHSDFSGAGLATARARIYTRDGTLVASAVQEGLLRYSEPGE